MTTKQYYFRCLLNEILPFFFRDRAMFAHSDDGIVRNNMSVLTVSFYGFFTSYGSTGNRWQCGDATITAYMLVLYISLLDTLHLPRK